MKRFAISAVIALTAASAHAEPVSVATPKAPISAEAASTYIAKLEKAVKQVCYEAASPVVGLAYYNYLACLKETRAEVKKSEPTGLYAGLDSRGDMVIASKWVLLLREHDAPGAFSSGRFALRYRKDPDMPFAPKMPHLAH